MPITINAEQALNTNLRNRLAGALDGEHADSTWRRGGGEVSDERLIALHGAVFVVYCSSVESMPLGRQISQKQEARLCGTCWRLPTQAQRTILPKT